MLEARNPDPANTIMDAALAARWRLILGPGAEEIDERLKLDADAPAGDQAALRKDMDRALGFVYAPQPASAKADLGAASVYLPRWLDLIRSTFPRDVVSLLLRDALQNRGLTQLLLEPETLARLEPDPGLIAALLAMRDMIPEPAREVVRGLVRRLVARLEEKIRFRLVSSVRQGMLARSSRRGSYRTLDWPRTLRRNLRHYDTTRSRILPERFYFRGSERSTGEWRLVILVDQSGSMAEAVIHATVAAAVLASVRTLQTHLVLISTEVADATPHIQDPVQVLMGAQIGGGTDIAGAVEYAAGLIQNPGRTMLVLVTDLYEGGDEEALIARLAALNGSRCRTTCLLAISSEGRADYNESLAARLAEIGTPSYAASPEDLVDFMAGLWSRTWPPERDRSPTGRRHVP